MVAGIQSSNTVRRKKPDEVVLKTVAQFQPRKPTMEKAFTDLTAYTQDTLGAFVKANAAMTKGVEQLSKNFFALASHALEEATEVGKRFTSVKSISEAFETPKSRFAQESIETLITEARKVQDLSATLAKDVSAPFADRIKATMSTFAATAYPGFSAPTSPSSKKAA